MKTQLPTIPRKNKVKRSVTFLDVMQPSVFVVVFFILYLYFRNDLIFILQISMLLWIQQPFAVSEKVYFFNYFIATSQLIKKRVIIISRENRVFLLHLILYCIFYNACYFRRTFLTNKTELLLSWSLLFRNKS